MKCGIYVALSLCHSQMPLSDQGKPLNHAISRRPYSSLWMHSLSAHWPTKRKWTRHLLSNNYVDAGLYLKKLKFQVYKIGSDYIKIRLLLKTILPDRGVQRTDSGAVNAVGFGLMTLFGNNDDLWRPVHFSTDSAIRLKFGIRSNGIITMVSQFDEGLWQQWPSPSTEISFGILQLNYYYNLLAWTFL